ncbi:MAG: hypothetical protein AAF399_23900, partial [Bacteroidota bacterium]
REISTGESRTIQLVLEPSAAMRAGQAEFTTTIFAGGQFMAQKKEVIPTEPFFRKSRSPITENPRQAAWEQFFGLPKVDFEAGTIILDHQIQQGDQLAKMWKAVLLSHGSFGYPHDPTQAYLLAKSVVPEIYEAARDGSAEAIYLLYQVFHMEAALFQPEGFKEELLQIACEQDFGPAWYEKAWQQYQKGDYLATREALNHAKRTGVSRAFVLKGNMYESSQIQPYPSLQEAQAAYAIAAEMGDPNAMLALARLSTPGSGKSWQERADQLGFSEAWSPLPAKVETEIVIENYYDFEIKVALHFYQEGYWKTVGWIKVPPKRILSLQDLPPHKNPLGAEQLYYLAYGGGKIWSGNKKACISANPSFFFLESVPKQAIPCSSQQGFQQVSQTDGKYLITLRSAASVFWEEFWEVWTEVDWNFGGGGGGSTRNDDYRWDQIEQQRWGDHMSNLRAQQEAERNLRSRRGY